MQKMESRRYKADRASKQAIDQEMPMVALLTQYLQLTTCNRVLADEGRLLTPEHVILRPWRT